MAASARRIHRQLERLRRLCPGCETELDATTDPDTLDKQLEKPEAGEVAICGHCALALYYDPVAGFVALDLKRLTPDQVDQIEKLQRQIKPRKA